MSFNVIEKWKVFPNLYDFISSSEHKRNFVFSVFFCFCLYKSIRSSVVLDPIGFHCLDKNGHYTGAL